MKWFKEIQEWLFDEVRGTISLLIAIVLLLSSVSSELIHLAIIGMAILAVPMVTFGLTLLLLLINGLAEGYINFYKKYAESFVTIVMVITLIGSIIIIGYVLISGTPKG